MYEMYKTVKSTTFNELVTQVFKCEQNGNKTRELNKSKLEQENFIKMKRKYVNVFGKII